MSVDNSRLGKFTFGLWRDVPPFRLLLGLCPSLAVTTTALNGLTMALAVTFVLFCSNLVVSVIRRAVPHQVRIPTFVVIIATFVTIVDLFLKGWFPPLSKALGPYVPLIIVNCIILGRAEMFASKHQPLDSLLDGLGHGLGFLWALVLVGSIRELLSRGSVFGVRVLGAWFEPWVVMILPAGAFLTVGTALAVLNLVSRRKQG